MSTVTRDLVQKLCNLCNVLRDAGITYQQYVTELSFLLFLKMAKETGQEQPQGRSTGVRQRRVVTVVAPVSGG